jgi:uncharacterized protein
VKSLHPNESSNGQNVDGMVSRQSSLDHEFSRQERILLLELAREAIVSALESREISFDAPTPHFAKRRGAFTSLYSHLNRNEKNRDEQQLRGCVGYAMPSCTVYRAVAETARAAAFNDPRFSPVTKEEAGHLAIQLSILSPPRPIRPEEIEVGRHGLFISLQGRRGLLLPQVASERQWDRITFLEQTCLKAGLPPDAWQKGATIQAFTAEVFGDTDFRP